MRHKKDTLPLVHTLIQLVFTYEVHDVFPIPLDKFTSAHKLASKLFELKERCATIRTGFEITKRNGIKGETSSKECNDTVNPRD